MRVSGLIAAAALALVGCARDQVGECPDMTRGDLVVTEIRGDQDPDDSLGIWIELYNASGATLDLEGLTMRFRRIDGSTNIPVIVRRSVTVAAGGYVVLGLVDDVTRPPYIDYGFAGDFKQGFLAAAAIDLETCGEQVDQARYDSLPDIGTYSFGGEPTVDNNDMVAMWCTNATAAGTPQQPNPACP